MSQIRYYRNSSGAFLGAFDSQPQDGIEVPSAPQRADAVWNGSKWAEPQEPSPPPHRILKLTIRQRLRAVDLESVADAARSQLPESDQHDWEDAWFIYSNDSRMISFLTAIGADPASILAPDPDAP
jgi:hypothetical protein